MSKSLKGRLEALEKRAGQRPGKNTQREISFWAVLSKVQTLADGGIRATFDLSEDAVVQMAELAACKINGVVLDVTCKPRRDNEPSTAISRTTAKRRNEPGDPGVQ